MAMSNQSQIHQQLGALGLLGMQETVKARIAQAEEERLSYEGFLELLLEDEMSHRAARTLQGRLERVSALKEAGCEPLGDVAALRRQLLADSEAPTFRGGLIPFRRL
jgi:hypothetical protein